MAVSLLNSTAYLSTFEDVPEKSVKSIVDGWNLYYLGAMQEMFKADKSAALLKRQNF